MKFEIVDKFNNKIVISDYFIPITNNNSKLLGEHIGIIAPNNFLYVYFFSPKPRKKEQLKQANTPNIFYIGTKAKFDLFGLKQHLTLVGWKHIFDTARKLNFVLPNSNFNKYINNPELKRLTEKFNEILKAKSSFNYVDPPPCTVPVSDRIIICGDSLTILSKQDLEPMNIFTGMPDNTEMNLDYKQYEEYRNKILPRIFELGKDNILLFTQTDKKATYEGEWFDKISIIYKYARIYSLKLIFHNIALYTHEDGFPQYQHYLCFSNKLQPQKNRLLLGGDKLYKNGTPFGIILDALKFLTKSDCKAVLDPFCGKGTNLALANLFGICGVGIDIDPLQCRDSMNLCLEKDFILRQIDILSDKQKDLNDFLSL
jgi:hypothetical protein